jgi:hypothetical protein
MIASSNAVAQSGGQIFPLAPPTLAARASRVTRFVPCCGETDMMASFAQRLVRIHGGFHRAAERLNPTQSTISQRIRRLELETKRPLFRRTTRSVALTDDGEMLLGDARRLL